MSDPLEATAKALVADYLKAGNVCLTFSWSPSGAMKYCGPQMRTDQLIELLKDALSYFSGNDRGKETLQ